eukprot:GFUD01010487.1.p1 GENE.GFUD01010487.1~~GFUD01010487.1.p1  ORF type:complete len:153 (+),score=22.31 GFUD01010487.1:256-714(+)
MVSDLENCQHTPHTMTYGIEWNNKPSRNEEGKKSLDTLHIMDLPVEVLVIILGKMSYHELRSVEMSSSFLRLLIIEHRLYSRLYRSLPYYNRQTLTCLHWLENTRAISVLHISRLCKKKLHQYYYQDCCHLLMVVIKLLHSGILKRKLDEIW